jgi:hypothetical protein
MENNFTEAQLLKVEKRIESCNYANNAIGGNCKIENMQLYQDLDSNIYMSYSSQTDGAEYNVFYIKYDSEGNETVLSRGNVPTADIEQLFSTLQPLRLK